MKKWIKWVLIGSCIALLAGLMFIVAGKFLGGSLTWYYNREKSGFSSKEGSYIEEHSTLDPFDAITVSNKSVKLNIIASKEYSYSYEGLSDYAPNVNVQSKTLYISVPRKLDIIPFSVCDENVITITVPDDKKDYNVKLSQSSGSTNINNVNIHGNISSTSGAVEITNSHSSEDLNILVKSGSADLFSSSAKVLKIDKSSGSSDIEDSEVEKFVLSSSSGMTSISNFTSPDIVAKTNSGKISAKRVTTDNITLKATSGSVDFSIVGKSDDYSCIIRKNSGSVHYDGISVDDAYKSDTTTNKSIIADVSSGSLDIDFVE